jgi:hypothetical protein
MSHKYPFKQGKLYPIGDKKIQALRLSTDRWLADGQWTADQPRPKV